MEMLKYALILAISITPIQGMSMHSVKEKLKQLFSRQVNAEQCAICLDDLKPPIRILNCNHRFDAECLTTWLNQHNNCPMCRRLVDPRQLPVIVQPPLQIIATHIKTYALNAKTDLVNKASRAGEMLKNGALLKQTYGLIAPTKEENVIGYFMAANISLSYCIIYAVHYISQKLPEKYRPQMKKQPPAFSSIKMLKLAAYTYGVSKILLPVVIQDTNMSWPGAFIYTSTLFAGGIYIIDPDEARTLATKALTRLRLNHPEQS